MATAIENKFVSINPEEETVSITDFTTSDQDIFGYFGNMGESADFDKAFVHALKIGVVTAKMLNTSHDVHIVESKFKELDSSFHQKMDDIFGDDGQFSELLEKHFGEDGKIIKEIFSPHKEGSPLQLTIQEFTARIEELKNLFVSAQGEAKEAEKGTQKGKKFEYYCESFLEDIAKAHGDSVRNTSNEAGAITNSEKGDFVYDIKELGKKIVWESKNWKSKLYENDIKDYLDEAMKNREADFGILVSRYVEAVGGDIGWFKEFPGKKLVVCLGTKTNSDEIHPEILHIAYRWVRARLLQDILEKGNFDPKIVQRKIKVLQEKLKALDTIQKQCTNIDNASSEIDQLAETLNEELDSEFEEILESLK